MVEAEDIDEEELANFFRKPFGVYTNRSVDILQKFGPGYHMEVAIIIFLSYKASKLSESLRLLEKHWDEYLKFRKVKLEVSIDDRLTPTDALFIKIYEEILNIEVIVMITE